MSTEPHSRVITTPAGDKQFQAIVHWQHQFGSAHCLARLQVSETASPRAVLSEIRSSPDELGIGLEFPTVADIVLASLPTGWVVEPTTVKWFAHYGEFSSYDAYGAPEDLDQVTLTWDGSRYRGDLDGHVIVDDAEVEHELAGFVLSPVPDVLRELGWTY